MHAPERTKYPFTFAPEWHKLQNGFSHCGQCVFWTGSRKWTLKNWANRGF